MLTNHETNKSARITYSRDWNEYRVRFYRAGVYQKDADYFTDDGDDAKGTALLFINEGGTTNVH